MGKPVKHGFENLRSSGKMILQMAHVVQGGLRQERKLETISNHLANASTTGFKGDVLSFDSLFTANMNIDFKRESKDKTSPLIPFSQRT